MSKAQLVITAVMLEGRSESEVRDYDLSRWWVQQLVRRYHGEGAAAFEPLPKTSPPGYQIGPHYRVRHDRIDAAGVIIIRHNSRLHHIGLSKRRRGTKVIVLIDDLDIRVIDHSSGTLIRKLVLDPTRDYQPRGVKCGNPPKTGSKCQQCLGTPVNDVPRHHTVPPAGLEPATYRLEGGCSVR